VTKPGQLSHGGSGDLQNSDNPILVSRDMVIHSRQPQHMFAEQSNGRCRVRDMGLRHGFVAAVIGHYSGVRSLSLGQESGSSTFLSISRERAEHQRRCRLSLSSEQPRHIVQLISVRKRYPSIQRGFRLPGLKAGTKTRMIPITGIRSTLQRESPAQPRTER
jgi:hypothetical protein